jgi:hypothetical protein
MIAFLPPLFYPISHNDMLIFNTDYRGHAYYQRHSSVFLNNNKKCFLKSIKLTHKLPVEISFDEFSLGLD